MKIFIYALLLCFSLAAQHAPSAFANVVTVRDLPASLQQFYPKGSSDFIQAFVMGEPEGSMNQVEVAYESGNESLSHSEYHSAGVYAMLVVINVADGRAAKPLAIRVNGQVLWGAWPRVTVPRMKHR